MTKELNLSKNVKDSIVLTPSNCTTTMIKNYFQYIFTLAKSGEQYPVDLEDVYYLVYSSKEKAVRALKDDESFVQNLDYQFLAKNGEKSSKGRPSIIYKLSIPCLEFFIARKVRPVFEVYRQVFHQVPDVARQVRADNTKMAKLQKENDYLNRQIEVVKGIYRQESELKNSCFFFLIEKGLYNEWDKFRKELTHKEFLRDLTRK